MEHKTAVAALSALAHEGRLAIFRLLVKEGPDGLTVGDIAAKLDMPGATLSFHLSQLKHAGLVRAQRDGRQLIQTADYRHMNGLIAYLTENCCGSEGCVPAVCEPAKAASQTKPKKRKAS